MSWNRLQQKATLTRCLLMAGLLCHGVVKLTAAELFLPPPGYADLIGPLQSVQVSDDPLTVIRAYYGLLSDDQKEPLLEQQRNLVNLIPAYRVARDAADSAEVTEVGDKMFIPLRNLRILHGELFKPEVVELLHGAYNRLITSG